jgi:hypothetical protein
MDETNDIGAHGGGMRCPRVMMAMMPIMMLGPLVVQAGIWRTLKRIERDVDALTGGAPQSDREASTARDG